MTSVDSITIAIHTNAYERNSKVCVRCFIETKQNQPTSWNKFIPVLSTTRLQAFKPKQASTDQPQGVDQQDVIEVSRAYVETFSTAFTSLPAVMFYYVRYRNSFGHANNMYDRNESRRSSFEQLSLQYTHINVHTAIPLHKHSSLSRTIASSQHQHRSTRSLHSQTNQCKNYSFGLDNYEFAFLCNMRTTLLLLVKFQRASKSSVVRHFAHVHYFCWEVEILPAKVVYFVILHMYTTLAGKSKFVQQK